MVIQFKFLNSKPGEGESMGDGLAAAGGAAKGSWALRFRVWGFEVWGF